MPMRLTVLVLFVTLLVNSALAETIGSWTTSQNVHADTKAIHAGAYLKEQKGRGRFIVKCVAGGTSHITILLMPNIGPPDNTETVVRFSLDGAAPFEREMGWSTLGGTHPLRALVDANMARTETTADMTNLLGQLRKLKTTLTITIDAEPYIFDASGTDTAIQFMAEKCRLKIQ